MKQQTAEIIYQHSKGCGGFEFDLHCTDSLRRYQCRKCQNIIAEEEAEPEKQTKAKKKAA